MNYRENIVSLNDNLMSQMWDCYYLQRDLEEERMDELNLDEEWREMNAILRTVAHARYAERLGYDPDYVMDAVLLLDACNGMKWKFGYTW